MLFGAITTTVEARLSTRRKKEVIGINTLELINGYVLLHGQKTMDPHALLL